MNIKAFKAGQKCQTEILSHFSIEIEHIFIINDNEVLCLLDVVWPSHKGTSLAMLLSQKVKKKYPRLKTLPHSKPTLC